MAFHEIAVDPEAIRSWRDFQLIWSKVGYPKGRLISNYPEKGPDKERKSQSWAWRVLASIKKHDIGSAKKVQTSLESHAKLKLIKQGRSFDHHESWSSNAAREHLRLPFAALIEFEAACDGCRCTLDDIEDENCPPCLAQDQHVITLTKQPDVLAGELLPMLRCAKEIRFVDSYFLKKSNHGGIVSFSKKHARVVQEIAKRMSQCNRVPQVVEFHMLSSDGDPHSQLMVFTKGMEEFLPKSWKATAFLWRENLGGRRFHARYILTDICGVGSDYGLDQGNTHGDQTDIYFLAEHLRMEKTADFSPSSRAFTLAADPHPFSGSRG